MDRDTPITPIISSHTFYRGAIYHTLGPDEYQYWPDGVLVVDPYGTIEACGAWQEVTPAYAGQIERIIIFPSGTLLLPGLIDLHTHLPQWNVRGCQADNLLTWLDRYIFPEERKFQNEDYAEAIATGFFQALLQQGTTTAAIFLTSHFQATHLAFRLAETLGNRVIMGQNLMDRHGPADLLQPTEVLLHETEQLCRTWHGADNGRLQYAWMPRFALSSTPELLAGLGRLRQQYPDVYLHTHLSEQPDEIAEVLKAFPNATSYTDVYQQYGLLGPKTILAHGVHLNDTELDVIHTTQSCLAHCPSSNFFLKSGRFPLLRVMEKNLRWGLGSDVGAGPSLSMLDVMKDAQYTQPDTLLSPHLLFYAATLGAARALDMGTQLGSFEPGKAADFIVVQPPTSTSGSLESQLSQLIYLPNERTILKTFVQGNACYEG